MSTNLIPGPWAMWRSLLACAVLAAAAAGPGLAQSPEIPLPPPFPAPVLTPPAASGPLVPTGTVPARTAAALAASAYPATVIPLVATPAAAPAVGPAAHPPAHPPASTPVIDPAVQPAGCSSCGNHLPPPGGCATGACGAGGCGDGQCAAGRDSSFCCPWDAQTSCGRFLSGLYQCICCPDPCYEPRWLPVANAAFFVDTVQPVTQMRLRWDRAWEFSHPDRAEYFMARVRTDPQQVGSNNSLTNSPGKGPNWIAKSLDYDALFVYNEFATQRFSFFTEFTYLSISPETAFISTIDPASPPGVFNPRPNGGGYAWHASGFGDMNLGTKSVILDCELLHFTFQFKTFLPMGNFSNGLGVGHVSLEPSFLIAAKLTTDCYLQAQLAYWIPIGGNDFYQGNVFHTHLSLNKPLWRPCPGLQLIGTLEFNDYCIMNGAYTATDHLVQTSNGLTPVAVSSGDANLFSFGPGVRLYICDKIDVGVGSAFAVGGPRWADEMIRTEFRWRF